MDDVEEVRFVGHEESSSEDEAHSVNAGSFETAAEAIAELQDDEDEVIAPERRIVVWPWGFRQLAKTYIVDAKLVYSTRGLAPDQPEQEPQ